MKSKMQMFKYQASLIRYALTNFNRLLAVPHRTERDGKEVLFYIKSVLFS